MPLLVMVNESDDYATVEWASRVQAQIEAQQVASAFFMHAAGRGGGGGSSGANTLGGFLASLEQSKLSVLISLFGLVLVRWVNVLSR